MEHVSVSTYLK